MKAKKIASRRERKNRTMSQELIVSIGLVFMSAWLIIGIVLFFMIKGALYQEKENLLESRVHNIPISTLVHIQSQEDLLTNANLLMNEVVDPQIQCAIIDTAGTIVAQVENSNILVLKERLLPDEQPYLDQMNDMPIYSTQFYQKLVRQDGFIGTKIGKNSQGISYMSFFLKTGHLNASSGMIQIATELTKVNLLIRKQMGIYAILSILMLCIVMLEIWYVTKRTLKPLQKMQEVIGKFKVNLENMDSEKSLQLFQEQEALNHLQGQKEVVALSKVYNEMVNAIQSAFEREKFLKNQMRQFVSDASHELRTPLTTIHGFAEVLELGAYTNQEQLSDGLKAIMSESERMNTLVTNLLSLNLLDQNRLTSENEALFYEKINIHQFIQEMAPQLQLLAASRSVRFNIDQTLTLRGQVNGIKQVILNLFQNAVQHTAPDQGVIEISGQWTSGKVQIVVQDNGKGIEPEAFPKIFDRFYRGEAHRSREEGGYGLGLAIVKSIVEQHQGEISVESTVEKGSRFIVELPVH